MYHAFIVPEDIDEPIRWIAGYGFDEREYFCNDIGIPCTDDAVAGAITGGIQGLFTNRRLHPAWGSHSVVGIYAAAPNLAHDDLYDKWHPKLPKPNLRAWALMDNPYAYIIGPAMFFKGCCNQSFSDEMVDTITYHPEVWMTKDMIAAQQHMIADLASVWN